MRIVKWQIGLDELLDEEIDRLRADWKAMLLPALNESTINELWQEIQMNMRR
jgi:hypothetical protein